MTLDTKDNCLTPPWQLENFRVDLNFSRYKKNCTSKLIFQKLFLETLDKYPNSQKNYTDGTLQEDKSGSAFVWNNEYQKFNLGKSATIFTAELFAILKSIEKSLSISNEHFIIFSDSLSALQAIDNIYSKNPIVQRIHESIRNSQNYYVFFWIPSHMGIGQNEQVDSLAKSSLQEPETSNFVPSKYDTRRKINQSILAKWNNEWEMVTNNKLKTIKPNITPWINFEFLNRKESVIITRLRIGHSHLTHKYLLDKTPQPRCTCGSHLSIQHIFSDCIRTSGMRRRYNLSFSSLSSNDVNVIKRILSFLTEARLFDRI
jgi:ribonuclease HI